MRKIVFLLSFFFLFWQQAFSGWYGNHAITYTPSSGTTICDSDGDTT